MRTKKSDKSEGDYGVFELNNCNNIRFFGYAGNGMPSPGYSIVSLENCNDILLANFNPQHKNLGHFGALGASHDPAGWFILTNTACQGHSKISINGNEQFALFLLGNPQCSCEGN